MPIVTLENGTKLTFPKGTSRQDIETAVNDYIVQNKIQPQQKDISRGEALLHTGLSGSTFGFGDELVGAATAGLLKATGKAGNRSFPELYREIQQEQQQDLQRSREQYPVQSFATELISGFPAGNAALKAAKLTGQGIKTITKGGALLGALGGAGEARNIEELPKETLKGAGIGAALGAGIAKAGQMLSNPLQKLIKPNIEAKQAFQEARINPTLGQISDRGIIGRTEAALERIPGAAGQFQKAKEQTINQIKEGIRKTIDAESRTEQGGGELIQEGTKNYVDRFKIASKKLYNRLDKFVPKNEAIKTDNIQSTINNIISELPPETAARERALGNKAFDVIRDLQKDIQSNNGQLNYGTAKYYRSEIGDLIDYKLPSGNITNANLNKLYEGLSNDMKQAFINKGPKAKAAFEATNNFYAKGKKQIEDKLAKIINNQYPERILSEALSSTSKGDTKIRSILRSLKPDEREILKSTVVERLGQNKEKEFIPNLFLKNYRALSPEARNILFKPSEQAAFTRFNKIIERVRGIENKANTSNTATQIFLTGTGLGLLGAVKTGQAIGTAYLGGKLFTNPRFVNWLAQGEKITGEKAINNHFKKLALIAASNPDIRGDILNFLQGE
jgi:hypothetical protein